MNDLRELIGRKVEVRIENKEGGEWTHRVIVGVVTGIDIDEFYFQEKDEPIYISVEVDPISKIENEDDYELLNKVPLDMIRSVSQ